MWLVAEGLVVQTSLQTKIMPNTDLFSKQKLIYLRLSNYGHNLIFVEKTSVRYKYANGSD